MYFLTCSNESPISFHIWNLYGTFVRLQSEFDSVVSMKIHPSNKYFLFGTQEGNVFEVDEHNKSVKVRVAGLAGLTTMAISPNGQFLACGNSKGAISIHQLTKGASGRFVTMFGKHTGVITSLAFNKLSNCVLSGATDQLVYVWDVMTGKELQCCEGHTSEITTIVTVDGPGCITAGGVGDGTLRLWNTEFGVELNRVSLASNGGWATALDVSSAGSEVYIGTPIGCISRWDVTETKLAITAQRNTNYVNFIHVNDDETQLITSHKGDIYLSDPKTLEVAAKLTNGYDALHVDVFGSRKLPAAWTLN